jgi:hypothetical protein
MKTYNIVAHFDILTARRRMLARQMMIDYRAAKREYGISFVDWLRAAVDPKLPKDRNRYKKHRTYMVADYMRRLAKRGRKQ